MFPYRQTVLIWEPMVSAWPTGKKIDGMDYYFEPSSGIQVKGDIAERDGKVYYLDEDSGQVVKNRFGTTPAERISTVEARFLKLIILSGRQPQRI